MELVDDVIALQSQVKNLENQVKFLQQAQKSASTAKPVEAPVIDVNALRQQLHSEFVTQINQLRAELNQLTASQAQANAQVSSSQSGKFGPIPAYVLLGVVGSALLLIWSLWPKSVESTSTPLVKETVIESKLPVQTDRPKSSRQTKQSHKPTHSSKQAIILDRQLKKAQRNNARLMAKAKALGIEVPDQ
jgi:hypothetical protein